MAKRPNFIDVRSQSHGPFGGDLASPRSLASPRLHVAGEIPPELSPLDAFAAQSRLLAKKLEQGKSDGGRRMSRLPPLTIESSFNHARPGYLRSVSAEESSAVTTQDAPADGPGLKTEVEAPASRPVSVYPFVSNIPPAVPAVVSPRVDVQDEEQTRGRQPPRRKHGFGTRMEQSPGPTDRGARNQRKGNSPSYFPPRPSIESIRQRDSSLQRVHEPLGSSRIYDSRALAPPRSPFAQKASSIRSVSVEESDEEFPISVGTSFASDSRKLSSSSALSNSPISPPTFMTPIARSPSFSSDRSTAGSRLSRPTFNFSRPLSRASEPSFEPSLRQASSDSQRLVFNDDSMHTPVSIHSEEFLDDSQIPAAASSYVYSRFSLPRGKILQRNSKIFQEGHSPADFRWQQPSAPNNGQPYMSGMTTIPPSPPLRPSTSSLGQESLTSIGEPSEIFPDQPSNEIFGRQFDPTRFQVHESLSSESISHINTTLSVASESTLRAPSQPAFATSADLSAEDHVTKGIDCHERGSLNESTYHLRIAARHNHPTGMLLYALACRHGWGMRPNQREGVQWLRKAADFAILEVADDEGLLKEGRSVDVLEQRTRKAQFALSVYELGVSHMNGWGIEQDKVLALRCFEIAGAWGDGDALAEAGFCYAQGIGCKKDLRRSAKFYRMAESKGISMVGNSWIYKSKYQDSTETKTAIESPEKSTRSKSKTRNMFGRMKSTT